VRAPSTLKGVAMVNIKQMKNPNSKWSDQITSLVTKAPGLENSEEKRLIQCVKSFGEIKHKEKSHPTML